MKKKFIHLLHYFIIALAVSLPFWLSWKIVAIIMVVYHLVFVRGIGHCPLTLWQFGTAEEGFIEKHFIVLIRLCGFPSPKRKNLHAFILYGLPILLVITAFLKEVIGL